VPEHDARPLLLEVEQVHLPPEPAVVALLGFLELVDIGVELFLGAPRGAVDAGQHRVVGIAAPIGAGHLHQLEGAADLADARHVRATAEVEPGALLVDLDRLVGRDRIHQLDLERLALLGEDALRLVAAPHLLGEGRVAGDDLAHLLLDGGEVLQRERLVAEEVVIEAVLDHRADRHLGARPQLLHRLGQHMRGIVPDQLQRFRALAGDELEFRVRGDGIGQIRQRAVELHGKRLLGERFGDG
jgi:hypothetical protein